MGAHSPSTSLGMNHAPLQEPSRPVYLGDDTDVGEVVFGDCLEVEHAAGCRWHHSRWAGGKLLPYPGGRCDRLENERHLGVNAEEETGGGLDLVGVAVGSYDGLGEVEPARVLVRGEGE